MVALPADVAKLILERMAVPDIQRVYILGSFSSPVTFSSQQYRAFNLIWSLFETDVLTSGDSVGIVGGGLAGVTAAAAALLKGCKVTLIEKAHTLFPWQQGNYVRYVHPNILRWPQDGSETPYTAFPALNWEHGTVSQIIVDLQKQWEALHAGNSTEVLLGYEVKSVSYEDGRACISISRHVGSGPTFDIRRFPCVVLALGFGPEKTLTGIPNRSYWENDSLHQIARLGSAPRSILVSGCGDGGLIDALRLRLTGFEHQKFVAQVLSKTANKRLRSALLDLEKNAKSRSASSLYDAYKRLPIPDSLTRSIKNSLRADTIVTINSPRASPLTPQSSALNRFLGFLLLQYGQLHYEEGKISGAPATGGGYDITFLRGNGQSMTRHFDDVIVRHGPESVIESLISKPAAEKLSRLNRKTPDPATQKLWPDRFYPPVSGEVVPPRDILRSAFRSFEQVFLSLYDPASTTAIGISMSSEQPQFAVWLRPSAEPRHGRPDSIAGLRVNYYKSSETDAQRAEAGQRTLRLQIGSEIINLDEHERAGGGPPITSTSVSCFVMLRSGEIAILGVGNALSRTANGRVGDRIALVRKGKIATIIGTLHSISTPAAGNQADMTLVDGALVVLSGEFKFRPLLGDKSPVRLTGVADPKRSAGRVFIVSRRSETNWGMITAHSLDGLAVHYNDGVHVFGDVIEIKTKKRLPAGGSGSLVVHPDGKALGIVFAGTASANRLYAFPLATALNRFDCTLVVDIGGQEQKTAKSGAARGRSRKAAKL